MSRHDRRQGNWIGAAVLIAVGVIGLLANFGLVERETLRQLWKLWPVIPLAIGVGILMRRGSSRGSDTD
jgi:hypothetical protein